MSRERTLVVIGGGAAGLSAARTARSLGHTSCW
ncbi:FAD-binding protein [Nocardiopsis lucentensis]|nr:FAD-binding protein [Nocardiopsis lucentensis]